MTDVAEIARGLTEPRKAMILALPADGSWGRVPDRSVAIRAWMNMAPRLIEHRHGICTGDQKWGLSKMGLAVRDYLKEQGDE